MDVADLRPGYVDAHLVDLGEVLQAQATVVVSVWEQSATPPLAVQSVFDRLRWDRELGDRWLLRSKLTAVDFGRLQADELGAGFDPDGLDDFVAAHAEYGAENVNAATEAALQDALVDRDDPDRALRHVFELLLGARLAEMAASSVATASNFGMLKAAEQAEVRHKVWQVNSSRPRPAHARMRGARAPLGEPFSNGMQHPGDWRGGADNVSGCRCSLRFEV